MAVEPRTGPPLTIGTRAARGMLWAYGSFAGGRLLVLASTAILARILSPRDFGLVALALLAAAIFDTLQDFGISQALIVSHDEGLHERASSAWVLSVAVGLGLALITAALGPLAAAVFHEHALVGLMPVVGANFLIGSLGATHYALAQRRLDFHLRTAAELADAVVRGATGIGLALAGLGAWSLVLGYVAGTTALTVTLWIVVPWRPRLGNVRRPDMRELVRFGGAYTALDVIVAIFSNADNAFVGRVLGPAQLGLYALGFRLPELLLLNLAWVAADVLFPAFATIAPGDRGHAFLVSLRYLVIIGLPTAAAAAILARPIVLALLGPKWHASIPVMQVLTVYAFCGVLGMPAGTAYKASRKLGVLFLLSIPRALILFPALALFTDDGIVAVAWCMAGAAAVLAVLGLAIASRILGAGARGIWRAVRAPLVATVPVAAVTLAIEKGVPSPWPALLAGGFAGAAVYLAALTVLAPEALRDLRAKLLPRAVSG